MNQWNSCHSKERRQIQGNVFFFPLEKDIGLSFDSLGFDPLAISRENAIRPAQTSHKNNNLRLSSVVPDSGTYGLKSK